MSKLWVKDGKLVVDGSGKPIICDDCPCEGASACTDCTEFVAWFTASAPSSITVTVSGYSGASPCVASADLNGTHVLPQDGLGWRKDDFPGLTFIDVGCTPSQNVGGVPVGPGLLITLYTSAGFDSYIVPFSELGTCIMAAGFDFVTDGYLVDGSACGGAASVVIS